jgi:hypothetical protein
MPVRTKHIFLPNSNAKMKSLTRTFNGGGYGTVLLDGGMGGQSSYYSIDNYLDTVNKTPNRRVQGNGLSDRISSKLNKLNIAPPTSKPRVKNITLSI